MAYNKEAYDILEEALKLLKTKAQYPYPRMVGYLQASYGDVENAKRLLELIQEWEGDK
jgi:hypothetical protein